MSIESFLKKTLNYKVIKREDGKLYLTRFYVFRKPKFFKENKYLIWIPNVYIHCFHSSDYDLELHNHPWTASLSLILSGSYLEEYRVGDKVKIRALHPGMFNYITAERFHRVEITTDKVWTLFMSGRKLKDWGFWDRHTKEFVHHSEHNKFIQEEAA